jgi:hypothetical protein
MAPTDVRVPLNVKPDWSTSTGVRSYADLSLNSLSLHVLTHWQGDGSQDLRLHEWRRDNLSAEEWLRIDRESRPERVARAVRKAIRQRYLQSSTSEEAAEETSEEQRTSVWLTNQNGSRE